MDWTQARDANWRIPYTGGWCLAYEQNAFNTDHGWYSATDYWNANVNGGNHPGELPPAGKTVGVFFALGNVPEGHVAISLDDGCVASSTQSGWHPQGYIHPNLDNLISMYGQYNGGCTYLGWTEYTGTVHCLVRSQPNATPEQIDQLYMQYLGRHPENSSVWTDVTFDQAVAGISSSDEAKLHAQAVAAQAAADAAAAQAATQTAETPAPVVTPPVVEPTPVVPKPVVTPIVIKTIPRAPIIVPPVQSPVLAWLLHVIAIIKQYIRSVKK